jgi:hypothetical protein
VTNAQHNFMIKNSPLSQTFLRIIYTALYHLLLCIIMLVYISSQRSYIKEKKDGVEKLEKAVIKK